MASKRNKNGRPEKWEIALIKGMFQRYTRKQKSDQDILAYFTRPDRSLNHRIIGEIRGNADYARSVTACSDEELDRFLRNWPLIDWNNGLHLIEDELVIKAREAMLLAVQCYNNPKTWFRSEVFIVLVIIAWTYLLHAYYKKVGVDYCHKDRSGKVAKTKHGADKYWELSQCLESDECPLDKGTVQNLSYLIELRHEIEHRMTTRIDDFISAKLQACCQNFNRSIKKLFDARLGFDRELSIALQFASFDTDQKKTLFGSKDLPPNISTVHKDFEEALSDDEAMDTHYTYRVAFTPIVVNRKGQADTVMQLVTGDTPEETERINRVMLKKVERDKYKPKQIVDLMVTDGYRNFNMHDFVKLWQTLDAKNATKGYGAQMGDGQWYWYDSFVERVREHCQEKANAYR